MSDIDALEAEFASDAEFVNYRARKRTILLLILAYSVVFGLYCAAYPEMAPVRDFSMGLPFLILGILWCFVDAEER